MDFAIRGMPALSGCMSSRDSLIALSYLSIPVTLVYFIRKRRDLPFNWMFVAFGIFILACGATHVMEVWTLMARHLLALRRGQSCNRYCFAHHCGPPGQASSASAGTAKSRGVEA